MIMSSKVDIAQRHTGEIIKNEEEGRALQKRLIELPIKPERREEQGHIQNLIES